MDTQPDRFGEFIIESVIGEGSLGKVYRARQPSQERWVALKVMAQLKEERELIQRFYREARCAASLDHPNIVRIYTVGEHEGVPFFAMEYVEGLELDRLSRCHPERLHVDEIMEVVRSVARALVAAGEHNVVHRDIKPANIMISNKGAVKVMDFGLARSLEVAPKAAVSGLVVGTPAYMAPEQGAGRLVDVRSDIYSLGCVLYECLSDHPPFSADNVAALLYKHAHESPEPPGGVRDDLPPELENICLKMLAKDANGRFQNPEELLEALSRVPADPALAEMLLAKRVNTILRSRKPDTLRMSASGELSAIIPASPTARTTRATSSVTGTALHLSAAQEPGTVAAASERPAGAAQVGPPAAERPLNAASESRAYRSGQHGLPAAESPPERGAGSGAPPPAASPTAAAKAPEAKGSARALMAVLREKFYKMLDGRWSYPASLPYCDSAEGLAAAFRRPPGEAGSGLGDCLLCVNWNKRVGCALAYSYELEARGGTCQGLQLATEQAWVWAGAGRFDMAVAMLDDYVKSHPDDPAGFRELARVYDRRDYRGPDKRRGIVLYGRFVELARRGGSFSSFEISLAEERAAALRKAKLHMKDPTVEPESGLPMQCFYHGAVACFAYGALTGERLVLARVAEVDPENGLTVFDLTGRKAISSGFLRGLKAESSRQEELARAGKELARLSVLSLAELASDPACVCNIACAEMSSASLSTVQPSNARCISLVAGQTHQLLLPEASAFRAEQCSELLSRRLAKK